MLYVAFPFQIDQLGRVASATTNEEHIVELIEQVLFTNPGERVNRPEFGCGALRLIFQSQTSVMAMTSCAVFQGALERWLGDKIHVNDVSATTFDSELVITVEYTIIDGGAKQAAEFRRVI